MRGPGYRNDLDVRRVWRCPQCGKQRRVPGDVTAVHCTCGAAMQLVEERVRKNYAPQPLASRELTVASFELTEEELARPVAPRPPREGTGEPSQSPPDSTRPTRPQRRPRRGDAGGPPDESRPPRPTEHAEPLQPEPPADESFGAGLDESQ